MNPGAPETWYTFVPRSWISYLATAVELDGLLSERTVPAASARLNEKKIARPQPRS